MRFAKHLFLVREGSVGREKKIVNVLSIDGAIRKQMTILRAFV